MKSYWPIVFNRAGHHHKRYRLKKVHDAGAHIIATIHHHLISKALDGTDATETNRPPSSRRRVRRACSVDGGSVSWSGGPMKVS